MNSESHFRSENLNRDKLMVTVFFFFNLSDYVLNNEKCLEFKTLVNDHSSCLFLKCL